MLKKISLILPCFNEYDSVEIVITEALEFQKKNNQLIEIIVINDGSTDLSGKKLNSYGNSIKVIEFEKNNGYGKALKHGISLATGEFLAFYDFDSTCSIKDLPKLVTNLENHNAKMAVGVRFGHMTHMPFIRRFGNLFFVKFINLLFFQNIKDACSGYRVFHKSLKEEFLKLPDQLNYTLSMTLHCIKSKHEIVEVPITYSERRGQSKLSPLKDGVLFLTTILKARFS
jgi:glycosyltransferase involved in cell wall biosynthesis